MAGCAFIIAGIGELAMETGVAVDVFANVFVTVKAKVSLLRPAKRLMTR
jgi:hypothetical protein